MDLKLGNTQDVSSTVNVQQPGSDGLPQSNLPSEVVKDYLCADDGNSKVERKRKY